jgi:hypothetical protein
VSIALLHVIEFAVPFRLDEASWYPKDWPDIWGKFVNQECIKKMSCSEIGGYIGFLFKGLQLAKRF